MIKKELNKDLYEAYVTDILKGISESLGMTVNSRFYDLVNPMSETEKSADEIALEVIKKAGLKTKNEHI